MCFTMFENVISGAGYSGVESLIRTIGESIQLQARTALIDCTLRIQRACLLEMLCSHWS